MTDLPHPAPVWLDVAALDGLPGSDTQFKLTKVAGLLFLNCQRFRAALLPVLHVKDSLPSYSDFDDPLEYVDRAQAALIVEHHWMRSAARDAVFACENIQFLLELVVTSPLDFGLRKDGRIVTELREISDSFARRFPDLKQTRNAAAHSDQIFRQSNRNAVRSSIEALRARAMDGGQVLVSDGMHDSTYVATINGKKVSFQVSVGTYLFALSCYNSVSNLLSGRPLFPSHARC